MKKIWDAIAAIIITAIALHLLFGIISPYAPFIIIALVLFSIGLNIYRRSRSW